MTHPSNSVLSLSDLKGKNAIVTGGTSGIGQAIVASLAHHGANVVTGSSTSEKVEAAKQLWKRNDRVHVTEMNVTDESSIKSAISLAGSKVHILVNNAGKNHKSPLADTSTDDFLSVLNLNVRAPFVWSREVAKNMLSHGEGGVLIQTCSVTTFMALQGVLPYGTSKAALWGLTMQMAADTQLIQAGIRSNAIAPGFIPADQSKAVMTPDRQRRIIEGTPMGRYGTPEEVAGAVTFLASDAARFMNGTCICIDGGYMSVGITESEYADA